jgi:hypothetical protein
MLRDKFSRNTRVEIIYLAEVYYINYLSHERKI